MVRKFRRRYFRTKIDTSQIAQAEGEKHNPTFIKKLFKLVGSDGIWGQELSPKEFMHACWILAPKFMTKVAFETLKVMEPEDCDALISKISRVENREYRHPYIMLDMVPHQFRDPVSKEFTYGDDEIRCEAGVRMWRRQGWFIRKEMRKPSFEERYPYFMLYGQCSGRAMLKFDNELCPIHGPMVPRTSWEEELEWTKTKYSRWWERRERERIENNQ